MKNRAICLLLVCALLLSLLPATAFAEEPGAPMDTPIGTTTYTADTSLGTLLTRTLENDEGDTRFPGTVTDLRVEGTTATVELSTDRESDLVLAVYPDSDTDVQMLASGTARIGAGKQTATVEIAADALPEFFVAAAYLLDPETHEPLSDSYISRYYTAEFQAFLQTTTADYEQELVLNLDSDDGNNFLVYGEDVLRFTETVGVNELTDNGDGTYTILHADARFRALKAGDSIAYTFADGTLLIAVAASVRVDGDTVTVTEDTEATLEAVFSYIKIDTTSVPGEGNVNMNDADNGVYFTGTDVAELTTYEATDTPSYDNTDTELNENAFNTHLSVSDDEVYLGAALANDVDITVGTSFSFDFAKVEHGADTLKGSLTFKVSAAVQVYRSDGWFSSTIKMDYSAGIEASIAKKAQLKILLGEPVIPIGATGVTISFPLYFVVEAEAKITVSGELKGTFGMRYDTDYGFENLTSWPSFEAKFEITGKIFVGIEMEASVNFIVRKLISAGISAKVGAEILGKLKEPPFSMASDSQRHACDQCIDGEARIRGKVDLKFEALSGRYGGKWTVLDIKIKLADFYMSLDYKEFGWNQTCPHIEYKVTAEVKDSNGQAVQGAKLLYGGSELGTTGQDGRASFYLANGEYTLTAEKDDLRVTKTLKMKDSPKSARIILTKDGSQGEEPDPGILHGTVIDSGSCGANVTWALYEDGTLIISGSGEIDNRAFYGCRRLTSVSIPNSVTTIGRDAFGGCSNLTSVTIPNGVTTIGEYAFDECSSLTSVTIPNSVTTIGYCAFYKCSSLTSMTIPNSVISIHNGSFSGCSNLTSVIVPNSVTTIGEYTFSGCSSLTSVTIPNSVTTIGEYAFSGCSSLTSVTIPNSVTTIGEYAFSGCSSLTSVIIQNGVTTIGDSAFQGCSSLTSVTIPSSVTSIRPKVFALCSSLKRITVDEANQAYCSDDGVLFSKGKGQIICYPGGRAGAFAIPIGVREIYDYAFVTCSSLTSVTIPDSVTTISYRAFYYCSGLTNVTIQNGIITIGNSAFQGCSNLTSVNIPNSVTTIGKWAFSDSTSLKNVYYSGTAAQWKDIYIGSYNTPLTSATIHYNSAGPVSNATYESSAPLELEFLAAYEGALGEQDGIRLASFSALKPGAAYTLLVTADESAEALLAPENLLYIAQGTAEEDGSLTLAYIPRLDSVGSVRLYGPSMFDLADSVITVEQFGDGSCRVTVRYGDNVLTEDEDYLLRLEEEGLTLTVAVTGCNGYSGKQTVTGEKLAVTVYLDANGGEGVPERVVMLLEERTALPIPMRDGWIFGGWATDIAAAEPDYLPGESYSADTDALLHALWTLPDTYVFPEYRFSGTPESLIVAVGDPVSLSVETSGLGLQYRWFRKAPNDATFTEIDNTTNTLQLVSDVSLDDCQYKCFISDSRGLTVETNTLTITPIYKYTVQAGDTLSMKLYTSDVTVDYGMAAIIKLNHIQSFNNVTVGTELLLPFSDNGAKRIIAGTQNLDEIIDCGRCGGTTYWVLYTDGILLISGTGIMSNYDAPNILAPWSQYADVIHEVVIDEGVTSIGAYAFGGSYYSTQEVGGFACHYSYGCTRLTSIVIPDNVTSIGEFAFSGTGLDNVTIGNGVTSIGNWAFSNCPNLTNVILGEGLTSIGTGSFGLCSNLSAIVIPNNVSSIGDGAFCGCSGLTDVTLGEKVAKLGSYTFVNCAALKTITVNEWLSTVEASAFSGCTVLTNVYYQGTVEDRDFISVKTGNDAFKNAAWHYGTVEKTYTVNYYVWPGEGAIWQQSKAWGESLILLDSVPGKYGYVFRVWNTQADGSGQRYQPGSTYSADADLNLYAQRISEDHILSLPWSTDHVEEEAFVNTSAEAVRVPNRVSFIADNAFDPDTIIISRPGGYAIDWAAAHGHECVIEQPSSTLFSGSGEEFIAFQQNIIRNPDSTSYEVFDAQISLIVYYTAVEQFDAADAVIAGIDRSALDYYQSDRLANVEANLIAARA